MDQQTLELLRALQSSERDAQTLDQIRSLLASERSQLVANDDRATLADLSELLEVWAETATPELAAQATAEAAQVAEEDLEQAERAVQLYLLSLERDPAAKQPLARLDALLCRRGEHDRLESMLAMHAKALLALPNAAPEDGAEVLRRLGALRAQRGADIGSAIAAYEQALDLSADAETIGVLAELYAQRNGPGDAEQAAELFCTLGDVLGAEAGIAMLERALDLVASHEAALDLLESYVPAAEQPARLAARWAAYIERSDGEAGLDRRRLLLARAYAAADEHRQALICLGPLVDKGEPEALSLQAAFLANLHESEPPPGAQAAASNGKAANGAPPRRPATLVGFRLPPGAGVPDAAAPAPEDAGDPAEHGPEAGDAQNLAATARNALAARSGGTLVGIRVPTPAAGDAAQGEAEAGERDAAAEAAGAATGSGEAASLPEERISQVLPRPPAAETGAGAAAPEATRGRAAEQPARSSQAPRAPGAKPAAGSATRASSPAIPAARAAGPAAMSAALASSARASGVGAQRASSPPRPSSSAGTLSSPPRPSSSAGTLSSPPRPSSSAGALSSPRASSAPLGPSERAAALKASRSSAPPPRASSSSMRAAAQNAPMSVSVTAAAENPIAVAPPALAAAPELSPPVAEFAAAITPAGFEPAQSALPAATPVVPQAEALEDALRHMSAGGKRTLDKRWWVVAGVAVLAVVIAAAWPSSSEPAAAEPSAELAPAEAPNTTASAAVPSAASPATASGAATATAAAAAQPGAAAAPAAPAAPGAAASLAAAVTPSAKPEPAAPAAKAPARPKVKVEPGPVRVRGGRLSAKAVTAALDDGLADIERCYAEAVEDKPRLEGRLTFAFNIDKAGRPKRVRKLNGTIKHAALQRCSTEAIEQTRFPKARRRAAQVTLPIGYSR